VKIEQRLRALESGGGIMEQVILYFADGSTRRLPRDVHLLDLLYAAIQQSNLTLVEEQYLEWTRDCVAADEPGGAQLLLLLKLFFHGPAIPAKTVVEPSVTGECRW
jgi:hypothetical protein